jgi:hypothetical protein
MSRSRVSATATSIVVFLASAGVAIGACGGKVSTDLSSSGGPYPTGTERLPPPAHPAPSVGVTTASMASQLAETYCKSFSSCCVASGQPPVDVARCRELTSVAVQQRLDRSGPSGVYDADIVAACIEAVDARVRACGAVDAKWWDRGDLGLFGPYSVQLACAAILGSPSDRHGARCSDAQSCPNGNTCVIDECIADSGAGEPCKASSECLLDSLVCTGSMCVTEPSAEVGRACTEDADCRLGLVCASAQCAPAREHPELYEERSSPYRVGIDTCQAFTFL